MDLSKLPTRPSFENLPRRRVAERLRLDLPQPTHGEGIRVAVLDGRSFHPRGYDATHGGEAGTCLRIFRRSRKQVSRKLKPLPLEE